MSLLNQNQAFSLQNTHIFVAGDVMLDAYIEGNVSRVSPEAPVQVLTEKLRRTVLGGAGNVAANVASFGAQAYLCGRVGTDEESKQFLSHCHAAGIKTDALIKSLEVPTITKTRILAGSHHLLRIDKEVEQFSSSTDEKNTLDHFQKFVSLPLENKCLVISDYAKGFLTESLTRKLISMAQSAHIPVVTDPNKSLDLSRYQGSSIVKPNLKEGRNLLNHRSEKSFASFEQEMNAIADHLLKETKAKNIAMSLSEKGLILKGSDAPEGKRFLSTQLQVADVSGAGDTMVAFLAMGIAAKLPMDLVAQFSNVAAGVVCGKVGTATLTLSEFLAASELSLHHDVSHKFIQKKDLPSLTTQLRAQGRKIVFTNGCFDILHAGHVKCLQEARALGDILIVGLNSDESVSRLKGPSRPVQKEHDRASILAGLSSVSFVALYDEDTPLDIILSLKPDVLVKGGEYASDESLIGAKEVKSWGGSVARVAMVPGRSTTNIIDKSKSK